jgi:thiamine pyrophosphokinase
LLVVRHALVLADGSVGDRIELDRAWPGWDDDLDLVVAADGGARHAARLGLRLDRWVGDGDSFEAAEVEALRQAGVDVRLVDAAKDESDAELAVLTAIEADAARLTILGALGGARADHALANIWLLAHPALVDRPAVLLDARARIRLVAARSGESPVSADLSGRRGDLVTLLPFGGDATGVTTRGLRYPLVDEPLIVGPSRGLSNVRDAADASVRLRDGRLLVIETPATLSG